MPPTQVNVKRTWYRIENQTDPAVADIYIFDFIGDWIDDYFGFGVSAKSFVEELGKLPEAVKTIRLHVNSPGGDVFGAAAIASELKDQQARKGRTVEVLIEGLAASSATIVTCAGSTVRIGDNALMMIHNPWSFAIGEAKDMRKVAAELDKVRSSIIAAYRWRSELSAEKLGELMDAMTWMNADEAILNGFADEKISGLKAAATIHPRGMKKLGEIPAKYRERVAELVRAQEEEETVEPDEDGNCPEGYEKGEDGKCHLMSPEERAKARARRSAAPAADVLAAVEEAGLSVSFARDLIKANSSPDQVKVSIARAKEIRALCAAAKCPELAEGYIRGSMAIGDVKAQITTIKAKLDKAEVDTSLSPDPKNGTHGNWLNPKAIYAERNKLGKGEG